MSNSLEWTKRFAEVQSTSQHRVRLYEAKLIHQFDHRYATFLGQSLADCEAGNAREITSSGKGPETLAVSRYFIPRPTFLETAPPVTSAALGYTSHGHPAGDLTRDDVLDNITLYWLTGTAVSCGPPLLGKSQFSLYNAADVSIPAAVSVFPGENYQAPRSWAERAYHNLIYFNEVDKGGHYRRLGTAATLFRRGPRGLRGHCANSRDPYSRLSPGFARLGR